MPQIIRKRIPYVGNIYDSQPVGEIIQCERETPPAGYIELGETRKSVLRSKYPELFKQIGTTYGAEDDEHFNLPSIYDARNDDYNMSPRVSGGTSSNSVFLDTVVNRTTEMGVASCGSWNITDGPAGNVWYNYLYIPHRLGIGSDGAHYGTMLLFQMTDNTSSMFINHLINRNWYGWLQIH